MRNHSSKTAIHSGSLGASIECVFFCVRLVVVLGCGARGAANIEGYAIVEVKK